MKKTPSTKGKPTLLTQAAEYAPTRRNWIERLPKGQREQVIELLKAKKEKQIELSNGQIVELLVRNGIDTNAAKVQDAILRIID